MGNTNTHKVCSVGIELSALHDFVFVVPNHLVDENGNIDDGIIQEITEKFEWNDLTIDDCDGSYGSSMCEIKRDFDVLKDCGDEDIEMQTLPIFGDNERE